MRKQLFNRYLDLASYRAATRKLLSQKLITKQEAKLINQKLADLSLGLITPKTSYQEAPRPPYQEASAKVADREESNHPKTLNLNEGSKLCL